MLFFIYDVREFVFYFSATIQTYAAYVFLFEKKLIQILIFLQVNW